MPRDDQTECRALLLDETDGAYFVRPSKAANKLGHWIPKSQIGYCRKETRPDGLREMIFTIPTWLVERKNAWDIVP